MRIKFAYQITKILSKDVANWNCKYIVVFVLTKILKRPGDLGCNDSVLFKACNHSMVPLEWRPDALTQCVCPPKEKYSGSLSFISPAAKTGTVMIAYNPNIFVMEAAGAILLLEPTLLKEDWQKKSSFAGRLLFQIQCHEQTHP